MISSLNSQRNHASYTYTSLKRSLQLCVNGSTVLGVSLLLGFTLMLGGCSILPQKPPVSVYVLRSTPVETPALTNPAIVQIHPPRSSGMLSSSSIVVMPTAQQVSVYSGARWDDTLPRLLQDYLIQNFRTAAVFEAVVDTDSRIASDYHLVSDMRAFHSSYVHAENNAGNPAVEVEFDVQLISADTRKLVAQRRFSVVEPSNGSEVDAVVEAFNRAASTFSAELLGWTAQSIAAREE